MDWTHRIAGLALATLLPAVAGASTPKGMVEVREEVLDNGLKVLLLENHRSPAVTFQVWYRVGSRNEVDGKSGMAHFLEHMLFKGTDKVAPEEVRPHHQKAWRPIQRLHLPRRHRLPRHHEPGQPSASPSSWKPTAW